MAVRTEWEPLNTIIRKEERGCNTYDGRERERERGAATHTLREIGREREREKDRERNSVTINPYCLVSSLWIT